MELSLVQGILKVFKKLNILVIGDIMVDEYLWGHVDRISPEAPVQVLDLNRQESTLGGAGNVVRNVRALGARATLASVVGRGLNGQSVVDLLNDLEVDISPLLQDVNRPTSKKTRVIAANQQVLRIDRESRRPLSHDLEKELVDRISSVMPRQDAVLISDYGKGVLTNFVLREVITLAKDMKIPVFVDPKGKDFSRYSGATCITPNKKEVQVALGRELTDEADLLKAGQSLLFECNSDAVLITRSQEGMTLFMRDGGEYQIPTQAREVYDVTGAGDTVLSVLGTAVAAGLSLPEASEMANLAAGIVVGKVGTSTVSPKEILEHIDHTTNVTSKKIGTVEEVARHISLVQAKGGKVVFTNGCFDLLHVGHIKYLEKARELGDLLVVAINSDHSVKRLKGSKRPLINQDERAMILGALACVDHVLIFEEDTPLRVLAALKPDILVKGGDYTKDQVVGRELVESYGGCVELISYVDGRSTSKIINQILEKYGNSR